MLLAVYVVLMAVVATKVLSTAVRAILARVYWATQKAQQLYMSRRDFQANQRAWKILKENLNPWQRMTLRVTGTVTTWSGPFRLRIGVFQRAESCVLFLGPVPISNLCIICEGYHSVPRGDEMLAVILMFKANRGEFLATAVFKAPFPGMAVLG